MGQLTLKMECSGGTHIKEAFEEAIRIATLLNCYVDFDFNGCHCSGVPNGSVKNGIKNYDRVIADKNDTYKFVMSHP